MAGVSVCQKRRISAALIVLELINEEDKEDIAERERKSWMKRRDEKGLANNIVKELSLEDTGGFKEMMRMDYEDFLYILKVIEKDITPKEMLGGHRAINAKSRLIIAIRFLATGESYRSLRFQFRISTPAISYIINDVCSAINRNLAPLFFKPPSTPDDWVIIAKKFEERWQFPNCLGAIDGKHIVMQPPPNAGSHYYNYKHTHSMILLAIAGPDYECLYADIGTNGRISDGGVWNKSSLSRGIETGEISLPKSKRLPYGAVEVPYVFLGDNAFALKTYLMKPYSQSGLTDDKRIYNYRHSRARRISENLFGIIANRWRVFRSVILLPPETIQAITMATLTMHNFLRKSQSKNIYCPIGITDAIDHNGDLSPGIWCNDQPVNSFISVQPPLRGHNACNNAKKVRDILKDYFCNEGAVDWQWNLC